MSQRREDVLRPRPPVPFQFYPRHVPDVVPPLSYPGPFQFRPALIQSPSTRIPFLCPVLSHHNQIMVLLIIIIGILGRVDCRDIFRPYLPYISFIHPYKYHISGKISQSPIPRRLGGLRYRSAVGLEPTTPHRVLYGAVGASAPKHPATQTPLWSYSGSIFPNLS